jgi:glycosyltransferase involved in cell wall biosynthesis
MPVTVSAALCTHNGARFVEAQLLTILRQSAPPVEIIVSDDASTDGTLDVVSRVIETWRAGHPGVEVRILRNTTALGVTANFEQALAACSGDLIALCDQDDLWHPQKLERMTAEFDQRPSLLLLHTDARIVDEAATPVGETLLQTLYVRPKDIDAIHDGRAADVLLRRNIVTGATVMLRRELVERSRPFPASWVHDEWLAMIGAVTGEVDLLEQELIDYRQHGANQIGASTLDAAGKIGRLRASRTARNQRLLDRACALADRAPLLTTPPSEQMLSTIDAKLHHERMRSTLPAAHFRRFQPVFSAWRSGDYQRFGLGLQDVLRDLVQPV